MGILDDAIREHLDLKRRRGADPTEIERLEREALGPVRRGPGETRPADSDLDPGDLAEPEWDDAFEEEEQLERPETSIDNGEPPHPLSNESPTAAHGSRVFEREEPMEEDGPPASDESQGGASPPRRPATAAPRPDPMPEQLDRETAEYDVKHPPSQEPAKETDDMLEETPEFLQDTPDHERLWFEQRPPKDFDFDG